MNITRCIILCTDKPDGYGPTEYLVTVSSSLHEQRHAIDWADLDKPLVTP
jgi:hypothetical protein